MTVRKVGKNTYRTGKDKGPKLKKGETATRKIRSDGTEAPWRVNKHKHKGIYSGAGPRRDAKLSAAEKKATGK